MAILTMSGVDKRYGGVRALADASLAVEAGEVHGLLGPNGSGKSTLNKVLTGTVAPDRADIEIDGESVTISNPRDAHRHGIAAVYQQLSLVPQLTVAQNLVLGVEPHRAGFMRPRAAQAEISELLARFAPGLGAGVTAQTTVRDLAPGQMQLIEIAKALLRHPRILVLDEATASLRSDQVALVFEIVRELTAAGTSVIFVSHRLDEIMQICTRATILRTGKTVAEVTIAETTERELVTLMVGDVEEVARSTHAALDNEVTLEVAGLTSARLHDVSFTARSGEVLGLGGLQGQGQSELLLTLFGAQTHTSGTISAGARELSYRNPRGAMREGFALVPGDRGTQGLFMKRPIIENISIVSLAKRLIAGFIVSMRRERSAAQGEVDRLHIVIGALGDPVTSLSGGNAQKVVIAKWLLNEPRFVLLDDPTKGVDISAKAEIYAIIRDLTSRGVTVLLNSSDDRELTDICDRVLIFYEGRILGELVGDEISHDSLVSAALLVGGAGHMIEQVAEGGAA